MEIRLAPSDRALDKSSSVMGLWEASQNKCRDPEVVSEACCYCLFAEHISWSLGTLRNTANTVWQRGKDYRKSSLVDRNNLKCLLLQFFSKYSSEAHLFFSACCIRP